MDIRKYISDHNPDAIIWEPEYLDDAIIGISTKGTLIYDIDRLHRIFVEAEGMSEEDAWDHLGFNLDSAYVGEYTPIQIHILNEEYEHETTDSQPEKA